MNEETSQQLPGDSSIPQPEPVTPGTNCESGVKQWGLTLSPLGTPERVTQPVDREEAPLAIPDHASGGSSPSGSTLESVSRDLRALEDMVLRVDESLSERVARLESALHELALRKEAAGPTQVAAVRAEIEDERARCARYEAIWRSAPLHQRVQFLRTLLGDDPSLSTPLSEATGLLEAWQSGRDVEAWLGTYPALFIDSYAALILSESQTFTDLEVLATETLAEVREVIDRSLHALGAEWITPQVGTALSDEHQVVGEVHAPEQDASSVAGCVRRGLRVRGRVLVPAQVCRYVPQPVVLETIEPLASELPVSESPASKSPASEMPPPAHERLAASPVSASLEADQSAAVPLAPVAADPDHWPAWLRQLHRPGAGAETQELQGLQRALMTLATELSRTSGEVRDEEQLRQLLLPIVPLLGPGVRGLDLPNEWLERFRGVRDELHGWLRQSADIRVFAPSTGAEFNSECMAVTGERRTAHPQEAGTVARLDRVGLMVHERVLLPARVVRYTMGDPA